MYIVFYKSNHKWWSRLIKWWTNSNYSHCELYNGSELIGISTEQSVRKKVNKINPDKWDIFEIKDNLIESVIDNFFEKTKGSKYDWRGIIYSYIFNRKLHSKNKYTCSEWIIELMDSNYNVIYPKNYIQFTPQDVHDILKDKEII